VTDIQASHGDAFLVESELQFTLIGLCRACGGDRDFLTALVDEGVLHPRGAGPEHWHFDGQSLRTARTASNLARDLELDLAGIALVVDLLAQIEALQGRLRRAGLA